MSVTYDHVLIRYGELGLKGKNRIHFIRRLRKNIEHQLKAYPNVRVQHTQGRLFVSLNGQDPEPIVNICKNVFGIYSLSLAIKVDHELENIKKAALFALQQEETEAGKSFKVEVKRANKGFPITSQEMNHILGSHLLKNTSHFHVDVHHPDIEIKVEIRENSTYIMADQVKGLGGLPVGTGGKTLVLLSGGIDSPVAGYLAMKRGVALDAIHFHSPPFTSERAKQKVLDLAEVLSSYGHAVNVHLVPFTKFQQEIHRQIPEAYSMTVMRRMMLRISEHVCRNHSILSMTTGESLGQVASQTMESMHAINDVTNFPILRPLVSMDKEEIISISKEIGTYDISIRPYEDCCTVFLPKNPVTKPRVDKVRQFEQKFDYQPLLEEAIENIEIVQIKGNQGDEFETLL